MLILDMHLTIHYVSLIFVCTQMSCTLDSTILFRETQWLECMVRFNANVANALNNISLLLLTHSLCLGGCVGVVLGSTVCPTGVHNIKN